MQYEEIRKVVNGSTHVLILQADNPDGDSLGSALALEAILSELGKKVTLCCAVDIAAHLKYLPGWDRVQKTIPHDLDTTIVVDASTESLFEYYENSGELRWVKTKPLIIIDHHTQATGLSYASHRVIEEAVATSEVIYRIARELDWPLPLDACEMMAMSIMSDSLGLTTEATTPESFRIMADLVERGVSIPKLDQGRRELMRKEKELIAYKGELLQRVTFDATGRIASIIIPWKEIERYSPLYNPSMLVIDDMCMTVGVDIAVAYKLYNDGKITAKIRSNFGKPIASDLAAKFGGGGHPYASGFKIIEKADISSLKQAVEDTANQLLNSVEVT